MHKTKALWDQSNKSLSEFLEVADTVCIEIVDYFLSVVPPVTLQTNLIQLGSVYAHDIAGNPIYLTIYRERPGLNWIFAGILPVPNKIY